MMHGPKSVKSAFKCSRYAQLCKLKLRKIRPNQVVSLESEMYQSITLKTILRRSLRSKREGMTTSACHLVSEEEMYAVFSFTLV